MTDINLAVEDSLRATETEDDSYDAEQPEGDFDYIESVDDEDSDDESNDEDAADDEDTADDSKKSNLVEFEFEGEKFSLPESALKKIDEGILRQADYTKKTQAVAKEREALEKQKADFENYATVTHQSIEAAAELNAWRREAVALENALQSIAGSRNPDDAQYELEYRRRLDEAYQNVNTLSQFINSEIHKEQYNKQQKELKAAEERKLTLSASIEQSDAALKKEIPNWSPQLRQQVINDCAASYASYGIKKEELEPLQGNAVAMRILFDARLANLKKNKTPPKPAANKTTQPKSAGGARRDVSDMSDEEYISMRLRKI